VLHDSSTGKWVIPSAEEFLLREPVGNNGSKTVSRTKFPRGKDREESRFGLAGAAGKFAVYQGNRLHFVVNGNLESNPEPIQLPAGTRFDTLLWDRAGRLLTLVSSDKKQLRADSFRTSPARESAARTIVSRGERLATAEDGLHLIERSVELGISRIDAVSGSRELLNASLDARQDAPIAVSPDGQWIAAVSDRHVVRLLTSSGAPYANLPVPRETTITLISWHPSGQRLCALTDDGFVQVWSLGPWQEWIKKHGLTAIQEKP
jgi:WD40 repeat protein